MKTEGTYTTVTVPNDLHEFLNGYEFAANEDGQVLIFGRDELEKYADPSYYEDDDKPNENVMALLNELLEKTKNKDLIIIY